MFLSNISNSSTAINFLIGLTFTIILGIFAPRTIAFMPAIVAIGFTSYLYLHDKQLLKINLKELFLFGSILFLGFISAFWAPDTAFSLERVGKASIILIPCLWLLSLARHIPFPKPDKIISILVIAHALIASFLLFEKLNGHPIIEWVSGKDVYSFKLNRSFVIFSFFTLPILFLIQHASLNKIKKIALLGFVISTTALPLYFTESQTAQLCFLIGLVTFLIYPKAWIWPIKALLILSILFTLSFPFTVKLIKDNVSEEILTTGILHEASIIHRLEVWNHAANTAIKNPIHGNGIEALRFLKSNERMKYQGADSALHAHNAVLQAWVEFGLIGTFLGCVLLFYILQSIYKTENLTVRHLYLTMFISCLCCAFTAYGLWQSWQLGLFMALAAFTIYVGKSLRTN